MGPFGSVLVMRVCVCVCFYMARTCQVHSLQRVEGNLFYMSSELVYIHMRRTDEHREVLEVL